MKRVAVDPRPNWIEKLRAIYFEDCVRPDGTPYWIEGACFELTEVEAAILREAAQTCQALVGTVIEAAMRDRDALARLGLSPELADLAQASWRRGDPSLYGRLDFAWDGVSPPKLLEYNADTPTTLYETAVVQWLWLTERDAKGEQFNRVHEALVRAWRALAPAVGARGRVHVASVHSDFDCSGTAAYVGDCANEAGIATTLIDVAEIGLASGRLVDLDGRPITHMFKLYPWDWLASDDPAFFAALMHDDVGVLEPAWRAAAASKGLLAELWAMAPTCPNLLPAFHDETALADERVGKPLLGRQGSNIKLRFADRSVDGEGSYGAQPFVWQARTAMPAFDGRVPVFGIWVVAGEVCGLGIREDAAGVTGPNANFIPHRIV